MSYSISATAATKDEVGKKVEEQLAQVVTSQPVHEFDRQTAQDAAEAVIEHLVAPGEGQEVTVYVSGSLGWNGDPAANSFTSANLSVTASIRDKATS